MLILVDCNEYDYPPTWTITLTKDYKTVAVFEDFLTKESAIEFLEKEMTRYAEKYVDVEVAFWNQDERVFRRQLKYQGGVQV